MEGYKSFQNMRTGKTDNIVTFQLAGGHRILDSTAVQVTPITFVPESASLFLQRMQEGGYLDTLCIIPW